MAGVINQNLFERKNKSSINQQQFNGGVAQLVRARDYKPEVSGSIPLPATTKFYWIINTTQYD